MSGYNFVVINWARGRV